MLTQKIIKLDKKILPIQTYREHVQYKKAGLPDRYQLSILNSSICLVAIYHILIYLHLWVVLEQYDTQIVF